MKAEIESIFKNLRHDKNHHLGLGDIRLTIAQQEEIIKLFRSPNGLDKDKLIHDVFEMIKSDIFCNNDPDNIVKDWLNKTSVKIADYILGL